MATLYLNQNPVKSVFSLIGKRENDMTYSIAYGLTHCEGFLTEFIKCCGISDYSETSHSNVQIFIQTYEKDSGITDIELVLKDHFHIIVEAKRGWIFPSEDQLQKYIRRASFTISNVQKRLIVVNESNQAFTDAHFQHKTVGQFSVDVISWKTILELIPKSKRTGKDFQNRILKELSIYLKNISTMQDKNSNRVYVVSLSWKKPDGCSIPFIEIVRRHNKYFHPVGGGKGGWPSEPPNYIAFRHDGHLQSIHKIDSYETFKNPRLHFEEFEDASWELCYLYNLGPAIVPGKPTRTGKKITRSMRVWAELDLLLTSATIEQARDLTHLRINQ